MTEGFAFDFIACKFTQISRNKRTAPIIFFPKKTKSRKGASYRLPTAVTLTAFCPFDTRVVLVSVRHFRNELDAYQPDFLFGIVRAQLVHGIVYLIRRRFLEIVINVLHVVLIHDFIQEIVNVQLRP